LFTDIEQERSAWILLKLPSRAWKNHPINVPSDALVFISGTDCHVERMYAAYPPLVPQEHVLAARICRQRQILFEGEVSELSLTALPNAKHFAALSNQNGKGISRQIDLTPGLNLAISHFISYFPSFKR
jgi:hypothetical protein